MLFRSKDNSKVKNTVIPVYFTSKSGNQHKPILTEDGMRILIPLQHDVRLEAGESKDVIFDIFLFLPKGLTGVIRPTESPEHETMRLFRLYSACPNDAGTNIFVRIKNELKHPLMLKRGSFPISVEVRKADNSDIYQNADLIQGSRDVGRFDHEKQLRLELIEGPISCLHDFISQILPDEIFPLEINSSIILPHDYESRVNVMNEIAEFQFRETQKAHRNDQISLEQTSVCPQKLISDFSVECLDNFDRLRTEAKETESYLSSLPKAVQQKAFDAAYSAICEKLAVLNVDILKNQTLTRETFAKCQMSDDFLSTVYDSVTENTGDFPSYVIRNAVLYKIIQD